MVKRTLLVAFSCALFVISAPTLVKADPVISAPFVTVGVGNTFSIAVRITGATDLSSWQFDLAFDPTLVRANSVTEGPFLSSSGTQSTLFVPGFIDNGAGHILGVTDLFTDISPPPSGDGVLANIQFTALAPGVSPLTFSNAFLNLSEQGFSNENGQITVTVANTVANTMIPTLTEWGVIALILLIGILSIYFLKRPSISS